MRASIIHSVLSEGEPLLIGAATTRLRGRLSHEYVQNRPGHVSSKDIFLGLKYLFVYLFTYLFM